MKLFGKRKGSTSSSRRNTGDGQSAVASLGSGSVVAAADSSSPSDPNVLDPVLLSLSQQLRLDALNTVDPGCWLGVWRGRDTAGQAVAVRSVHPMDPQQASQSHRRVALLRELDRWRQLRAHPNVAAVLGLAEAPHWAVVFDWESPAATTTTTLQSFLYGAPAVGDRPVLDARAQYELVSGLASGLAFLHGNGVVHGCLSSRSVAVRQTAPGGAGAPDPGPPRLFEYGLQSFASGSPLADAVRWQSAEQLESSGEPSNSADVWALGCVIYEVYFREMPWSQFDASAAAERIQSGGKLMAPPGAPWPICDATEGCWQRDPDSRPSAADLVDQLADGWLEAESTWAPEPADRGAPHQQLTDAQRAELLRKKQERAAAAVAAVPTPVPTAVPVSSGPLSKPFGMSEPIGRDWYFPSLSRQDAERLLSQPSMSEGSFIVRNSSQPNCLALSFVNSSAAVGHGLLRCDMATKTWSIEKRTGFRSLNSLLHGQTLRLLPEQVREVVDAWSVLNGGTPGEQVATATERALAAMVGSVNSALNVAQVSSPSETADGDSRQCAECHEAVATLTCSQCSKLYCDKCSEEAHAMGLYRMHAVSKLNGEGVIDLSKRIPQQAEEFLKTRPVGSFLVRPSSQAGALSLSHRIAGAGAVGHALITMHRGPSKFGYSIETKAQVYPLLDQLLQSLPDLIFDAMNNQDEEYDDDNDDYDDDDDEHSAGLADPYGSIGAAVSAFVEASRPTLSEHELQRFEYEENDDAEESHYSDFYVPEEEEEQAVAAASAAPATAEGSVPLEGAPTNPPLLRHKSSRFALAVSADGAAAAANGEEDEGESAVAKSGKAVQRPMCFACQTRRPKKRLTMDDGSRVKLCEQCLEQVLSGDLIIAIDNEAGQLSCCRRPSPAHCTCEGRGVAQEGAPLVAKDLYKFTVVLRSADGAPCRLGGADVRVTIAAPPSAPPVALQVSDRGTGRYDVYFEPFQAGPHAIVAQLNQVDVKGSPFTVAVVAPDKSTMGDPNRPAPPACEQCERTARGPPVGCLTRRGRTRWLCQICLAEVQAQFDQFGTVAFFPAEQPDAPAATATPSAGKSKPKKPKVCQVCNEAPVCSRLKRNGMVTYCCQKCTQEKQRQFKLYGTIKLK